MKSNDKKKKLRFLENKLKTKINMKNDIQHQYFIIIITIIFLNLFLYFNLQLKLLFFFKSSEAHIYSNALIFTKQN